jgi:hypothetical protein
MSVPSAGMNGQEKICRSLHCRRLNPAGNDQETPLRSCAAFLLMLVKMVWFETCGSWLEPRLVRLGLGLAETGEALDLRIQLADQADAVSFRFRRFNLLRWL